ncbi:glycosyltransferase family 4 protein [Balneatrix alpica]|uniref:glycosyltransferase family 4 protein n=1 Tax=Balneatrix alpica TaxID=75684 RepID=UPI00273987D8|nr:glycosyltransferase family 4 protein [Balneatrix alpica]
MKLALIRQHYRPDGGAERFVSRALQQLGQQQNLEVSIITRGWANSSQSDYQVLICNPAKRGRISRERDFAEAAMALVQQQGFDLVQSHERIPGCSLYRAGDGVHREWLNQRSKVLSPLARWWQEHDPYHRYVLASERAMFEHPNLRAVICNSEMVRQDILRHFRIAPDKLRLIYNGVDRQRFHPGHRQAGQTIRRQLGIPPQAHSLLFVGSGFMRKGLQTLLEALPLLERHYHLIVVGKDKQQRQYQQWCQRQGLASRVHFVGVQQDVTPYYGAADALVHPALYDPFPNVIWEALACGVPVFTTPSCGGAELLLQPEQGSVFATLNAAALAQQLRQLPPVSTEALLDSNLCLDPQQALLNLYQELLES